MMTRRPDRPFLAAHALSSEQRAAENQDRDAEVDARRRALPAADEACRPALLLTPSPSASVLRGAADDPAGRYPYLISWPGRPLRATTSFRKGNSDRFRTRW